MKMNENTAIIGDRIVLVPYRKEHVAKYHEWMCDPELRELTASEPLSLEEEYEMQRKWQVDEDKLTFIILARGSEDLALFSPAPFAQFSALPMIGDVNVFLKGAPTDDDFEAELEIMIAEPSYRRSGRARATLALMLTYITAPPLALPPASLIVRIGESNTASMRLFEQLGFVVTKRVAVFEEVEMRFRGEPVWAEGRRVQMEG